ncbi:MAG: PhzF family phenazine biosynthesis protein [Spirochaetia bacterium]|nr:PhzF family phenazine biosynthesis protein [Spirochaetia bacterium]
MQVNYYSINSFAKTTTGGNPAAVVLDSERFTKDEMLKIANSIGFSETAFVFKSNKADFEVRFFTPKAEVDLCGHATIGLFSVLSNLNKIKSGKYKILTKAGILEIKVEKDGSIFMEQTTPIFSNIINTEEIIDSLRIKKEDLINELPCQIVSTGLKDIIIPVKDISILNSINPNFDKIKDISKKYNVIGYHLFALSDSNNIIASCRNFAPLYEINEEAATGTSSGALACYLYKYGVIDKTEEILLEQGISMNKSSLIKANLEIKNKKINKVLVGGLALNLKLEEISI